MPRSRSRRRQDRDRSRKRSRSVEISADNNRTSSRSRTRGCRRHPHVSRRSPSSPSRSRSPLHVRSRKRSRSRNRSRKRCGSQLRSSSRQSGDVDRTLGTIMNRLATLEANLTSTSIISTEKAGAQAIVDANKPIVQSRSGNYYVSNFDPSIHNIDAWCDEVDRAQILNHWDDQECLSRVAGCLKGDAKTWLNEWVSDDRSWFSFKREFKPLCSRKLDYANILFETMSTTSEKYLSYAEYARRTLLRLRIVKGLSDELMTLIVIRGIDDPQVKAAAANANLSPDNLVSFLSIYQKPNQRKNPVKTQSPVAPKNNLRPSSSIKCFNCKQAGHKSYNCPMKIGKLETRVTSANTCTFCKKSGHTIDNCFAKARSEPQK